jgi:hypothetical protein
MKTLPLATGDAQSREAFASFLRECRAVAAARARPQLVSITVEADHLEPRAVLDSIYETGALHG